MFDRGGTPEQVFRTWLLLLAGFVLVCDLISKNLAQIWLMPHPLQLLPVLDLRLQFNSGAAFSLFSDNGMAGRIALSLVSLLLVAVITAMILRLSQRQKFYGVGLALVLGGGLGNLYERVIFGYVTDFVSVHWQHWYFPTFNTADAAISCGAALVLWAVWIDEDAAR